MDEQRLRGRATIGFQNKGSGFIAPMVEFGHKSGEGKFTPAHPFIRQAGEASAEGAVDVFTELLAENIDR